MEDLKQTPPASIESDAASEYMRGYSDGLAQAEAMKIDAARYRFMRDGNGSIHAAKWFYDEELDATIDAQMSANENAR